MTFNGHCSSSIGYVGAGIIHWPEYLPLLEQWFPTFFHLRTPRQPISINCTLNISKTFVINIVAVISNLFIRCNCK